jgi:N-acetylneuraminic acid mutarotase
MQQTRQRDGWRTNKIFMKTIQQKATQTIIDLTSMKHSSLSLISRFFSFAALAVAAGLLVQPCSGASGVFSNTGSLAVGHDNHTATLLPNGKVLVAGGINGPGDQTASASTELYDPASGTWTATGSLATARYVHTATLLSNGKVLVAGGFNNSSYLASAELYDPASGTWTATGSLTTGRYFPTATLLPNGKVLVVGGFNDSGPALASAELYDPASGTWTATGSLATARFFQTATLLPNGKVLVAGGNDGNGGAALASAELYDPASGTWTKTDSLATARALQTATLLPDGRLLVAGGRSSGVRFTSAELYDSASGTWTATGSLGTARVRHTATLLPNGQVLVTGGVNSGGVASASAELYDPASASWRATGNLVTARIDHTATLLSNGGVLVAGGNDGSNALASAELYVGDSGGSASTPTGNNVTVTSGNVGATFPQVASAGTTTFTPINPNSAGAPPSGFTIAPDAPAYEITTTATYTPPIEVSFTVSSVNDAVAFSKLRILHGENGVLVDRTSRQDFNARLIYAQVSSLSPFVLAMTDTSFQNPSQLLNVATRLKVLSGDNVLIGGFIITGTAPKRVIILGIGPSLAQFFSGTLANPTLELHQGDTLLQTNDDWKSDQQAEVEATGLAPSNDLESAIVRTLDPGSYTAILRGKGDATGIGVVQAYDLNQAVDSKFGNIATRGFVDSGDNVMIGGFIIGPANGGSATVVVRAIGPSLTNFGVSGALPDPTVELHDGNGATIAFNDNWADDANQGSIPQSLQPSDAHESALYRVLPSGDYTAVVRGAGNSTGIGLVEVYNLP